MSKKKNLDLALLIRIIKLSSSFKKEMILSLVVTLLIAVFFPLQPYLYKYTLDKYVAVGDIDSLNVMILWIVALLIAQTFLMFLNTYITNWIGQSVIKSMRLKVYGKLSRLKASFYDKTAVGTLVTRSINDIETIANLFASGIITIVGDFLQIIGITVFMFIIDWRLAFLVLTVLPLLLIASNIFRKKVKSSFSDVRTEVTKLNTFVQEHITGMSIVQIFNRQDREYKRFKEINLRHRDANKRSVLYYAIFFPAIELITALALALLVWFGTRGMATDESMTFGTLTAFILYIGAFFRPIRQMADRFNTIQMGMVASERIFNLVDREDIVEEKEGEEVESLIGEIEFKNVWFAYVEEDYVLKDISFKVKPGETLAFVGATGSGKSTIINLVNKFYKINKGQILIDGKDISEYESESLRSRISVVLQDVFLFSGTILDNVRMENTSISLEEVKKASEYIGADYFIEKLPGAYDYKVMERGSSLSLGQRQLVSFVRALACNPDILILDEATSSVDTDTEEVIQQATEKLLKDRTSIVIAHRLSTIKDADKIIVLDKGQILEEGSHLELLESQGAYSKLYHS